MLFNGKSRRRRRKSLREEFLSSKATFPRNRIGGELEERGSRHYNVDGQFLSSKEDSYLTSTPASFTGSFLRNKLENPLFKPLFTSSFKSRNLSITSFSRKSALKKVQNASDEEEDSEIDADDDTCYDEAEADDEEEERDDSFETESKPRAKILDLSKFKAQKLRRNASKSSKRRQRGSIASRNRSRFGSSFFDNTMTRNFLFANRTLASRSSKATAKCLKGKKKSKASRKRNGSRNNRDLRVSSDSNSSNTSNYTSYDNDVDSEADVDILTKLEDTHSAPDPSLNVLNSSSGQSEGIDKSESSSTSSNTRPKSHLLYTHKGQPVRLQFFFDYLLISPVTSKLSLSLTSSKHGSRGKPKPKIVYYEDLASWTNNHNCLRLIHIKQKHTAEQQRTEIKLFVNKKKVVVTPKELNEELKDRVSILIAGKMNCSSSAARRMLERNATEDEVMKVVQKIDRSGKKCIAQSYTKDLIQEPPYELLNV